MKFGLTQSEFDYFQKELVSPLKKVGATVWIFGSRARGDHKKFSDVDVLVESDDEKIKTLLSKIREKIEEGNFPYKVDLLLFEDLAQSYKDNVLKDRVQLHLTGDIDAELAKNNLLKFERTIQLRNLREGVIGFFVSVIFTKIGLEQESLLKQIASFEIALAGIFIGTYIHYFSMSKRILTDDKSSLNYIEKHKKALETQISLLSRVRYWYILPIAIGIFTLIGYDIYQATQGVGNIFFSLVMLTTSTALFIFVIWLNEYKAVKNLQKELDSLK